VIGIAPIGGKLQPSWQEVAIEALTAGLDIAAGLHQRLSLIPEITACAARHGRKIHDVRHTDTAFNVATGIRRPGRRLLTVGTDCALGKKYTALAITKAMRTREFKVDFRATGQTGILIAGQGVAVDAVVADFIAGAAETLSPANAADHWDIVEGQGSLFHPAYAGVTLGLLHGSQPDALVLCHDPTRASLNGFPHVPLVALDVAIEAYLSAARLTNPNACFVGVAMNTSAMDEKEAARVMIEAAEKLALPCVDPIRTGVAPIVDALEESYGR
jgi:uncharacterized NAD-dependent epimerase/dehydratase family protein